MARRDVGRGPSPPAGQSLSSAAASINFNISAGNGVAEALEGSSMQKKDCIPASNLSLNKGAFIPSSSAVGLQCFYGDPQNDLFLNSIQTRMEGNSKLEMGIAEEGSGDLQNAMEVNKVEEVQADEEMQCASNSSLSSSVQLRSPVPGDTASPSGAFLQTSSNSEGALSALAAVGSNSIGKFSSESFNHHLPDMPTPSSSAAEVTTSCPPSLSAHDDSCGINHSSTVFLSDMVATTSSPYLTMSAENRSDINMEEEESGDGHVTCMWSNCHQEFSSLARLVAHLDRSHVGPMTQFVCLWENCPRELKPFDARYKLTTHLRCHTGEKPYHCEVTTCKRSFSRLENLKLHTRTHTGEKPYLCHHVGCNKRFNNTSDRAKHMKTHITRKPYACKHPGCNKSYTDPSSMRKHIKYTHRVKEEVEDSILTLPSLPRRKRNSTSCSSSSSSSSTPRTPQQPSQIHQLVQGGLLMTGTATNSLEDSLRAAILQNQEAVPHNPATQPVIGALLEHSVSAPSPPPAAVAAGAQIIPVLKLQGSTSAVSGTNSPSLLLPGYKQSQPVMMIVPAAGSTTGTLPFSSTASVASATAAAGNLSASEASQPAPPPPNPLHVSLSSASQVIAAPLAAQQSHAHISAPPSSSSSIEDQLRLHIVHLQQQLYQSQVVAAAALGRASNLPRTCTSSLIPASDAAEGSYKVAMPSSSNSTSLLGSNVRQLPMLASNGTIPILGSGIGEAKGGTMIVSNSTTTPILSVAGSNGTVLPSVLNVGGANNRAAVLPQFIPIPVIHTNRIGSDAQFVFMSS